MNEELSILQNKLYRSLMTEFSSDFYEILLELNEFYFLAREFNLRHFAFKIGDH